ncbi:MAG: transcription antitermination factor NusB [Anaerolineae bacterium]|nr:transcription antitermination factor NusB [Anaerolineae bacterium]MDW8068875.1 transcription antitermination factor NusB [Anaerolineae bacterium]
MKARRLARAVALQALYEIDSVHHPPEQVLQHRLEEIPLPEAAAEFARCLVYGVLQHRAVLDAYIQKQAPEWPLEQVACIDRNILRMALYEFAVDGRTPVKVAINEAVELGKMFGSDSTPRFVNGVLGALVPLRKEITRRIWGDLPPPNRSRRR